LQHIKAADVFVALREVESEPRLHAVLMGPAVEAAINDMHYEALDRFARSVNRYVASCCSSRNQPRAPLLRRRLANVLPSLQRLAPPVPAGPRSTRTRGESNPEAYDDRRRSHEAGARSHSSGVPSSARTLRRRAAR